MKELLTHDFTRSKGIAMKGEKKGNGKELKN